ncbi:hypothetical protein EVAR_45815_1 [Eumeta japonica]|uniref:HTH myb-type domain-containing protein n=1 Tax=Eumeta variegata TaxID=151549 RepID=A0A4C1X3V4_EUMVA|nr:hypothetical protein EVAR_45815_1 [Eumeta japonica]
MDKRCRNKAHKYIDAKALSDMRAIARGPARVGTERVPAPFVSIDHADCHHPDLVPDSNLDLVEESKVVPNGDAVGGVPASKPHPLTVHQLPAASALPSGRQMGRTWELNWMPRVFLPLTDIRAMSLLWGRLRKKQTELHCRRIVQEHALRDVAGRPFPIESSSPLYRNVRRPAIFLCEIEGRGQCAFHIHPLAVKDNLYNQ